MRTRIFVILYVSIAVILLVAILCYALYALSLDQNTATEIQEVDKTLVLHNWQDYISPEIISRFEGETGIKLRVDGYDVTQQAVADLQSNPGAYDLVVVDDISMSNLADYKMIEKLDYSKLPGYSNIDEKYLKFQQEKIRSYALPYLFSLTGLAYNKKYISDKPTSWSALWDKRYSGRVALLGDQFYSIFPVKMYLEQTNEGDIVRNFASFQSIADKLKANKIQIKETFTNIDKLNKGELWLSECYNGDLVYKGSSDLEFIIPKEGALLSNDSIAICSDSKHKEFAYQFLNFLLQPEIMAKNASYLSYMPPSGKARDFMAPELQNNPMIFPDLNDIDKYKPLGFQAGQFSSYQKLFQNLKSNDSF